MATEIFTEAAATSTAWPIKRIALAVDGSAESERAAKLTKALALTLGAEVTVLHFREKAPFARYGGPAVIETSDELFGLIRSTVEDLAGAGIVVNADVEDSRPLAEAKPIAKAAERFGSQLIVIGSRGLSTGRAAVQGSVSHDLIHATKVPVLIVR